MCITLLILINFGKKVQNNFFFRKILCIFAMEIKDVKLTIDEIKQLLTALKDSGLEFTGNLLLYDKLSEYVK